MNIHCEYWSRFHSDSKRIRSGFESKRRESLRIHKVFAQQYGFANFGRVFTVIHCETLSWEFTESIVDRASDRRLSITQGRKRPDLVSYILQKAVVQSLLRGPTLLRSPIKFT